MDKTTGTASTGFTLVVVESELIKNTMAFIEKYRKDFEALANK